MRGERELEAAVRHLAAGLAGGLNLDGALASAAAAAPPSLRDPLARVVATHSLGTPLPAALALLAPHCPAAELDLVARSLALGLRCGGSLPRLLTGVALVLAQRRQMRSAAAARSTEARLTAVMLAALPLLLALYLAWVDPAYLQPLWQMPAGRLALGAAGLFWGAGAALTWRLLRLPELR